MRRHSELPAPGVDVVNRIGGVGGGPYHHGRDPAYRRDRSYRDWRCRSDGVSRIVDRVGGYHGGARGERGVSRGRAELRTIDSAK